MLRVRIINLLRKSTLKILARFRLSRDQKGDELPLLNELQVGCLIFELR